MTFIDWFKTDGDKLCTFITLSTGALGGVAGLSPAAVQACVIAGVLAIAAHQSFFPNGPK
jgi:hypothetical protein